MSTLKRSRFPTRSRPLQDHLGNIFQTSIQGKEMCPECRADPNEISLACQSRQKYQCPQEMIHRTVTALSLIMICCAIICLSSNSRAQSVEQLFPSIVLLYKTPVVTVTNGQQIVSVESGTGFLLKAHSHFFLVTANHVAKILKGTDHVVFGPETETPEDHVLSTLIPTDYGAWFISHPIADIAIAPLRLPATHQFNIFLNGRWLELDYFVAEKRAPPFEVPITTFGFPTQVIFTFPNSPLILSPILPVAFERCTAFDTSLLPRQCFFYFKTQLNRRNEWWPRLGL